MISFHPDNRTRLELGPLVFTHQVQKISISEQKSVSDMDAMRSSENYIQDSGETSNLIQIKLLFSGKEELGLSRNPENALNTFKGLYSLFRMCPITHVSLNTMTSPIAVNIDALDTALISKQALYEEPEEGEERTSSTKNIGEFDKIQTWNEIPVAFKGLQVQNVPEYVDTLEITVFLEKVDVSSFFWHEGSIKSNRILYLSDSNVPIPTTSITEKSLLAKAIKKNVLLRPSFSEEIFNILSFTWRSNEFLTTEDTFVIDIRSGTKFDNANNDPFSRILCSSFSLNIFNKFGFNKFSGARYPTPSYLGTSGLSISIDLVFNNNIPEIQQQYAKFLKFKEYADIQIKSTFRPEKRYGLSVRGNVLSLINTIKENTFVPISIHTETSENPKVVNCRIDLISNNLDYEDTTGLSVVSGGTDVELLKAFYDNIAKQEKTFRKDRFSKGVQFNLGLDQSANSNFFGYKTFWPIDKNSIDFRASSLSGLLNEDTIRAVLLHPDIDVNNELRNLLLTDENYTGQLLVDNSESISFLRRIGYAAGNIASIASTYPFSKLTKIFDKIKNIVEKHITDIPTELNRPVYRGDLGVVDVVLRAASSRYYKKLDGSKQIITNIDNISKQLYIGFLGNISGIAIATNKSATGTLLQYLAVNNITFSKQFYDALFEIILARQEPLPELPNIFSSNGLHAAFFKLITAYEVYLNENSISTYNDELKKFNNNIYSFDKNLYPDLLLPTYIELFGDDWKNFAPTLSDFGIISDKVEKDLISDNQDILAVTANSIVDPAVWFYKVRHKRMIRTYANQYLLQYETSDLKNRLTIKLPLNTEDIDILNKQKEPENPNKSNKTIDEIIKSAVEKLVIQDQDAARSLLVDLSTIDSDTTGDKLQEMLVNIKSSYIHNDSTIVPKKVSAKGIGAIVLRNLKQRLSLVATTNVAVQGGQALTTVLQRNIKFNQNTTEGTKALVNRQIDQLSDQFFSPERMFPVAKVYLVDRRGNDIFSDDVLYDVSPIISIDITLDKEDAELAVIKIADPLYKIQTEFFQNNNYLTEKKVLHSLRDRTESIVNRYKLIQGRAIQVRMGYGPNAYLLPIAFTGRITEIIPGDELTIVAQGWKAELINRSVSFFTDDPKNVSGRDLAIQAISYANPDGFGEYYGKRDANFILKYSASLGMEEILQNSLNNLDGVDIEGVGTRGIWGSSLNWISTSIGLSSNEKYNIGLDTRLKNIWYPDGSEFNNIFGWREFFSVFPDFQTDSWVIPIQPCWDVLKEATRHGWNYIVQTVPYETYSTIFIGKPDQPYFYRKTNSLENKLNNLAQKQNENKKPISEILSNYNQSLLKEKTRHDTAIPLIDSGKTQVVQFIFPTTSNTSSGNPFYSTKFVGLQQYILNMKKATLNIPYGGVYRDYSNVQSVQNNLDLQERINTTSSFSSSPYVYSYTPPPIKIPISSFENFSSFSLVILNLLFKNKRSVGFIKNSINFSENINVIETLTKQYNISLNSLLLSYFNYTSSENRINYLNSSKIEEVLYNIAIGAPTGGDSGIDGLVLEAISSVKNNALSKIIATEINEIISFLNKESISKDDYVWIIGNEYLNIIQSIQVNDLKNKQFQLRLEALLLILQKALYGGNHIISFDFNTIDIPISINDAFRRITESLLSKEWLENLIKITQKTSVVNKQTQYAPNPEEKKYLINRIETTLDTLTKIEIDRNLPIFGRLSNIFYSEAAIQEPTRRTSEANFVLFFPAYVYFFLKYIQSLENLDEYSDPSFIKNEVLHSSMKVFRETHFISNTFNIIRNDIAATTREMWNTVVIEHPSPGDAEDTVEDSDETFSSQKITAGANWIYYPKQEVTGVIGLQFHPGLTLSNKKIEVFTEINCQTPDVAAKLAVNRLAEGIKKMYRGNVLLTGMLLKPHDICIVADTFKRLNGPIGIESVVHHYNTQVGWVTNIIPEAVCESNPKAAILQTAVFEAAFNSVFNAIDVISDAFMIASIIVTLGASTPLAVGKFSTKKGLRNLVQGFAKEGLKEIPRIAGRITRTSKAAIAAARKNFKTMGKAAAVRDLYLQFGGLGNSIITNKSIAGMGAFSAHTAFRLSVIPGYVESLDDYAQLPVLLYPLQNGILPYTAGLDTRDSVFTVPGYGIFYSYREMQRGVAAYFDALEEEGENR